jgi:biopolymer transport protein ExbD
MKSYLQPKPHRLRVDINTAVYTNLLLILMSLILTTTVPLFRQPIPLHDLAAMKTNTTTIAPIIITIDHKGGYHLNTEIESAQSMSLDVIKDVLNKQFRIMNPKQTSICIQSDSTITYGKVMELIDWLQKLGAQHVGLLTTHSMAPSQPS